MKGIFGIATQQGKVLVGNTADNVLGKNFATMVFGDGGGVTTNPSKTQTALVRQLYQAALTSVDVVPLMAEYSINAVATIPASAGDFDVREVGIKDQNGVLVAVGKCAVFYKASTDSSETVLSIAFTVPQNSAMNEALPGNPLDTVPLSNVSQKMAQLLQLNSVEAIQEALAVPAAGETPTKTEVAVTFRKVPTRVVTATSNTAVVADIGGCVETNNASANTVLIDNGIGSADDTLMIRQGGAGQTTITFAAGITVRNPNATLKLEKQYASACLHWKSATEIIVDGRFADS